MGTVGCVRTCVGTGDSSVKDIEGSWDRVDVEKADADADEESCVGLRLAVGIDNRSSDALVSSVKHHRHSWPTHHLPATDNPRSEHSLAAFLNSDAICASTFITSVMVNACCTSQTSRIAGQARLI